MWHERRAFSNGTLGGKFISWLRVTLPTSSHQPLFGETCAVLSMEVLKGRLYARQFWGQWYALDRHIQGILSLFPCWTESRYYNSSCAVEEKNHMSCQKQCGLEELKVLGWFVGHRVNVGYYSLHLLTADVKPLLWISEMCYLGQLSPCHALWNCFSHSAMHLWPQ